MNLEENQSLSQYSPGVESFVIFRDGELICGECCDMFKAVTKRSVSSKIENQFGQTKK